MFKVGTLLTNIDELLNTVNDYELANKIQYNKITKARECIKYINLPCSFDIEVSSFEENGDKRACMYIWQLGINGNCVVGRTWDSFKYAMDKVTEFFNLNENCRLPIYVHNLSYEFQFIKDLFTWSDLFAREKRKVMKANTIDGLEFRCSYVLTSSSLEKVGKDLTKYKVEKLVGDLDYDLIRTPITPLTKEEIGYCINDVLVVMAKIQEEIELYGDVTKIPMTNTGRVRKYCQEKCLSSKSYGKFIHMLNITSTDEYHILKRAFSGGFTHANVNNVNKIHKNVTSYDFTSSYPAVMISEMFPMSSGYKCNPTIEEIESGKYNYIFNIKITNLRSKIRYEHYLSQSKCFNVSNINIDNGRIISADSLITTITEVDWDIIRQVYDYDTIEIGEAYRYNKGYLPTELVNCVLDFYESKTTLKDVIGSEIEYQLKKGMLNSVYGMEVTDPINDDIWYDGDWKSKPIDLEDGISKYNKSRKRFLFYPWGVYTTAYARHNLWEGILESKDDYIYSDTDSIKILNPENHTNFIEEYNERIIDKLNKACNFHKISYNRYKPSTIKGIEKVIGVWDFDGNYKKFKTLGAKRYLVETDEGIKCTIAGVNKKKTSKYISEQNNPFEFFNDNMTVDEENSGRLSSFYIDAPTSGIVTDYKGNHYNYSELSSIHLCKTEYNLTLSPIYLMLINSTEEVYN